ncbi:pseudaminic acid synthase [Roseobacter litoralis]|uniref:pseudaminic acid synthase n=1 Tax=Roseobacter litoralis TaxID=42443 RepID=UPI002494E634|nr:pseudaminic acid synthase [Roseobacter litoralis]
MSRQIRIANRSIGVDSPPYVIAELSANHNGDLERALSLVSAAAKTGADAVKLQTYRPDTITLKSNAPEFQITEGLWAGHTLYDLYEWAHTPWEWHKPLFERAREDGITIFSSPFDTTAVDLLEELGAPAYKIASFEVVDLPLIRYVASTGKPMIISTGMANADEIGEAIEAARGAGCEDLVILHCVSGYPAPPQDYNLATLPDIARRHNVLSGLSDHTLDNATAIAAVALGAVVIEKHFTLDRSGGGPDDSFSLEPTEFAALCRDAATAWSALGSVDYGSKSSEIQNVQFRRSLYFVTDIAMGQMIEKGMVRSVRPGFGIGPKHIDDVIGKRAKKDVLANTPVDWSCVDLVEP